MREFINCAVYLVALINPVSKVFILSVMGKDMPDHEMRRLAVNSSLVALYILVIFAVGGSVLLTQVFHVELYSFQIVGGLVLLAVGFKALSKGNFYEEEDRKSLADMSIVPLASPMIAGPATLTAAVAFPAHYGLVVSIYAMIAAVGVNLVVMLFSKSIGNVLQRFNIMGALIRITGMVVATIAVQLVLTGVATWYYQLHGHAGG
jgi:multiple antibiotic resistance protein